MGLITSVSDIVVTPAHIRPGDSITVTCNITAGSYALTGFDVALYGTIDGVNYLAAPIMQKAISVAKNATKAVTFTATASAVNATPDGRITAFAAGANNGIHDVRLSLGFRTVSRSGGEETASIGSFMYETGDVAGAFGKHYNPSIDSLVIERARYDPEVNRFFPDDEGERALVSCVLSMADPGDGQHFPCLLHWGANTATICHGGASSIHNRNTDRWSYADRSWFGEGMVRNIWPLFDYSFDTGTAYEITCVYGDEYESATVVFTLSAAFANLNLSGTGKGVAIGKFSASTENSPMFECAYPAEFQNDVVISGNAEFRGNVSVPNLALFRRVTVTDTMSFAAGGNKSDTGTVDIDVPDGYKPLAVAQFRVSGTGASFVTLYRLTLDVSANTLTWGALSINSSATTPTLTVLVLCFRMTQESS